MNLAQKVFSIVCVLFGLVVVFLLGYNINSEKSEGYGFSLPPGNAEAGKQTFVDLKCSHCHTVYGDADFSRPDSYKDLVVPLGGEVRVVKSYGELVTAIIHPSQSIRPDVNKQYVDAEGKSIMPDFSNVMTTRQMIDLVTYLEQHYEVVIPQQPSNYYPYGVDLTP